MNNPCRHGLSQERKWFDPLFWGRRYSDEEGIVWLGADAEFSRSISVCERCLKRQFDVFQAEFAFPATQKISLSVEEKSEWQAIDLPFGVPTASTVRQKNVAKIRALTSQKVSADRRAAKYGICRVHATTLPAWGVAQVSNLSYPTSTESPA